jgi:hypothetical protein
VAFNECGNDMRTRRTGSKMMRDKQKRMTPTRKHALESHVFLLLSKDSLD